MKKIIKNKGFMLVEILIAVSIITVSVLAFMSVAEKSIYLSRDSIHVAQAGFLLEEGAEAVRILRDNDWANISSLTPGTTYYPTFDGTTWTLDINSNTVGIFTRTVSIAAVKRDNTTSDISASGSDDPGTKLFTVSVSWQEGGTTMTKTLSFYISNLFS